MKKYFILIATAFLTFIICAGYLSVDSEPSADVAITQIAPHPSLDTIRKGLTDRLTQEGIRPDRMMFQNAQGSPATALQIAQKFVSLSPKVIVAITTPSAQAAVSAASSSGIPVIFSAVSSPKDAKLDEASLEKNGVTSVAGVCDCSPIPEQVQLIRSFLPHAKTIGVVYNAGEANSVALIRMFEDEARRFGLRVIHATVMSTSNVGTTVTHLAGKVDALYIPNDNTVISAFDNVLSVTQHHKIPVFTADPDSVARGALASVAYNQYEIGTKTADMVLAILLNHTPPKDLGTQRPSRVDTSVNLSAMRHLGLSLPKGIDTPTLLRYDRTQKSSAKN